MIHEENCTYEVATLAKKKGFNVPTRTVKVEKIEGTEKEVWNEEECRYITQWETRSVRIPTQSLLQRWLREEKGVCISVEAYPTYATKNNILYSWAIKYRSSGHSMECQQSFDTFSTYEKALEEALEFTLKELV